MFYLLFAAGGALGSFIVGIAFPLLFRFNMDLVITCCFTALLAFLVTWQDGWSSRLLWGVGTIVMAVQIFWIQTVTSAQHPGRGAQFLRRAACEAELRISGSDAAHPDERQRRTRDTDLRHR